MRAGACFTVSPFNWPSRMVRFVVLGGVCCVVVLIFAFFTGPISLHSWIFQISSIGCKDCHYRNDARSNRPKKKRSVAACEPKKLWEFAAGEALSVRGIGCSCSLGHFHLSRLLVADIATHCRCSLGKKLCCRVFGGLVLVVWWFCLIGCGCFEGIFHAVLGH